MGKHRRVPHTGRRRRHCGRPTIHISQHRELRNLDPPSKRTRTLTSVWAPLGPDPSRAQTHTRKCTRTCTHQRGRCHQCGYSRPACWHRETASSGDVRCKTAENDPWNRSRMIFAGTLAAALDGRIGMPSTSGVALTAARRAALPDELRHGPTRRAMPTHA